MTKEALQHPGLQFELQRVQAIIEKQSDSGEAAFDLQLNRWLSQSGKMLRPALFLIAAHFDAPWTDLTSVDERLEKLCQNAAAIEIIHMATLIHDDVIDDAALRRGRPSVQKQMGKDYAVYMGDYLFCKALMLVSDHDVNKEQLKRLSAGMVQVCLGEIRQYHSRYCLEPDLRRYFKIIASKTAALFALSLYSGAIEGGCSEQLASLLGKIGYNLGMAFQIRDDLLDYSTAETGKNSYQDILQGNYNLPIRLTLASSGEEAVSEILKGIETGKHSVTDLVSLIKHSGGYSGSEKLAEKYTRRALKYCHKLPNCESRDLLLRLLPELMQRQS